MQIRSDDPQQARRLFPDLELMFPIAKSSEGINVSLGETKYWAVSIQEHIS